MAPRHAAISEDLEADGVDDLGPAAAARISPRLRGAEGRRAGVTALVSRTRVSASRDPALRSNFHFALLALGPGSSPGHGSLHRRYRLFELNPPSGAAR